MSYRKIGGLHFIRVWRFQISFCITSKPGRKSRRLIERERRFRKSLAATVEI